MNAEHKDPERVYPYSAWECFFFFSVIDFIIYFFLLGEQLQTEDRAGVFADGHFYQIQSNQTVTFTWAWNALLSH